MVKTYGASGLQLLERGRHFGCEIRQNLIKSDGMTVSINKQSNNLSSDRLVYDELTD